MDALKRKLIGIGYVRVDSLDDVQTTELLVDRIRSHCSNQGIIMLMAFIDESRQSKNFKGPSWESLEKFLKNFNGLIDCVVVNSTDHLTRDLGKYLLKEYDLKLSYGVSIEVVDGKFLGLDRGMSLN
jgi:DNA invertase Pin-like site-specific DNA recombinase